MTQETPKHRPWTLMVYMAGDNGKVFDTKFGKKKLMAEMTSAGYQDIWEMSQVGTTDAAAVVCLFDTQTDSYLVEVRKGNGMAGCTVQTLPEVNTGSPDALADFAVQVMEQYPADHYALIIWNHGTGWLDVDHYALVRAVEPDVRSTNPIFRTTPKKVQAEETTRPIAYDDSSKDFLDTADLRAAFNKVEAKTGRKLDIIGMDACLMAMVEGARELAPHAGYFLASQEVEPMDGWPYQPILQTLNGNPAMTPGALSDKIVREFAASYQAKTRAEETVTQSAVALDCTGHIEALCKALVDAILAKRDESTLKSLVNKARSDSLGFQDRNYRDLGDFALQLVKQTEFESYSQVTSAAQAIYNELQSRGGDGPIMVAAFRPQYERATGMSIYLPPAGRPADKRAKELDIYRHLYFAQATGWPDLLAWLDADFETDRARKEPSMDDFLASRAADTLNCVLDVLIAQRAALSAETDAALAKRVAENGPAIYRASRGGFGENLPGRINDLLRGFWSFSNSLPPAAVDAMRAGMGAPERSLTTVPEAARQPLLDKLVTFSDFRTFDDPASVAAEVDRLVADHADRLAPDDRSGWQQLHDAHARDGDHEAYLRGVAKLLSSYPQVRKLIEQHRLWDAGDRRRSLSPGAGAPFGGRPVAFRSAARAVPEPEDEDGLEIARPKDVAPGNAGEASAAGSDVDAAADEVTRFANVHFPGKVLMEQEDVPLIVHVAGRYQAGARASEEQSRVSLKLSPLTVIVRPEGFDVKWSIGGEPNADQAPHVRRVQVVRERDCEPLVFFLKPGSAGMKRICVDLEQFDRRILTIAFTTEVVEEAAAMEGLSEVQVDQAAVASPIRGEQALPPDIELRVLVSADRRTLEYMLHSPRSSDYDHVPVGKTELRDDPLTYLKPIFDRLSDLAKKSVDTRSAADTRSAQRALTGIGVELYNEIFSDELREQYGRVLRKKYAGKSFLITTEEPWIPWELIAPSGSVDNEDYDDPPLCQTFRLTRWVADRPAPDQLKMAVGTWIAPPDNLAAAQAESAYFEDLHQKQWQVSLNGPLQSIDDVMTAMEGGATNLFHFACHGNFNADTPTESKLKLGTEFLTPRDIGPLRNKLKRSRPLVFLNACHGGRVGVGLTQLGGWAQTFLGCEASAFIGALWEVNDALAARFSQAFYDRLWGVNEWDGKDPLPLGEAFHQARLLIRDADQANPTWLAYVLYGDPDGQIILGG